MSYVYVASSWRNQYYPVVVEALLDAGIDVYDFRNPAKDNKGFHWSELDPGWENWAFAEFASHLDDPIAADGFMRDKTALEHASACVLVLPCGRSAHLEAGFAIGRGRPTVICALGYEKIEPELMYAFADALVSTIDGCCEAVKHLLAGSCEDFFIKPRGAKINVGVHKTYHTCIAAEQQDVVRGEQQPKSGS